MSDKVKNVLFNIFADLCFISGTATFFAIPWGLKNYPMHLNWNVFFVLASDTSGHDSGTARSIFFGFILPAIALYLVYRFFVVYLTSIQKINFKKFFFGCLSYFLLSVASVTVCTTAWRYFYIVHEVTKKPESSEFYKKNFVQYENAALKPAGNKRNVIVLFMESMEACYADVENGGVFRENLIPNLTNLSREGLTFNRNHFPGTGVNLQGTSWTVAGLLSKLSAVPYFNPFVKSENGTLLCLPKAKTLNDYLADQGYNQVFSMGSEKQFENRDSLFETHNVSVHDIKWYKENKLIPEDYQVFWGFEDRKLYSLAKLELNTLASKNEPFFYGLLTVDTHFPAGFVCPDCGNELDSQMKNVVRCADRMAGDFISWCKTQSWYKNTTIVIMGDHAYLNAPLNNFIEEQGILSKKEIRAKRGFFTLILNPSDDISIYNASADRIFSSYDMMPTILEAMGNSFENHKVAFGQSLVSPGETLLEFYNDTLLIEKETIKNTAEYAALKETD